MKSTLLNYTQIENKIARLAHQINENHSEEKSLTLIGLNERGGILANKIHTILKNVFNGSIVIKEMVSKKTESKEIEVSSSGLNDYVINKTVILVDDVVDSGQTLMYAASHILNLHPSIIRTVALIDRNHRSFPIKVDFVGLHVATTLHEHVVVEFDHNKSIAYLQ